MRNIAKKIKILRIQNDISQKELAEMLGVGVYTVSNIEQEKCEPAIDILIKLCIIFNITSDELLEIDTQEKRKDISINFNNSNNNGSFNF